MSEGDQDHDVLLVDLDGTVYAGADPIPGAVEALEASRSRGQVISYVTNNASRSPGAVAEHLAELGLTLTDDDVVTSAQAGAALLADQCEPGAVVLVVGADALADEVRAVGLSPTREAADEPVAVVQGHSPDTGWRDLAEACVALGDGALWVACNIDSTLPSERGLLPGNGSMVAALRHASGREPQVAGKPAAPLLRQAIRRADASDPLVVGDRLDTDIAGGAEIGVPTLLVLTGVSTAADLLAAPPDRRPTFVAADLGALADLSAVAVDTEHDTGDGWSAGLEDGDLVLAGPDDADTDRPAQVAALRALCRAWWRDDRADDGQVPTIRARDGAAGEVLSALALSGDENR